MIEYNFFEGNDVHENCKNCREAYDKLFAEVERLKQENESIKQSYYERLDDLKGVLHNMGKYNDTLKQQNQQLQEALKHRGAYYWDENEQSFMCDFCGSHGSDKHKEDCEYVRLIGGSNE